MTRRLPSLPSSALAGTGGRARSSSRAASGRSRSRPGTKPKHASSCTASSHGPASVCRRTAAEEPLGAFLVCARGGGRGSFRLWRSVGVDGRSDEARTALRGLLRAAGRDPGGARLRDDPDGRERESAYRVAREDHGRRRSPLRRLGRHVHVRDKGLASGRLGPRAPRADGLARRRRRRRAPPARRPRPTRVAFSSFGGVRLVGRVASSVPLAPSIGSLAC